MTRPNITLHNAETNETVTRQMTQKEYDDLIASGWTPGEEAEPE